VAVAANRLSSRALAVLLLAVVVPPAAMLVWLGARLLDQDRALLAQREQERRAAAATTATHALEASLAGVERGLSDPTVPDGMVRLTFGKADVQAEPVDRVAWLPAPRPMRATAEAPFAEAERLEYRSEAARALSIYQQLAGARDAAVRAGALQRAARVFRQLRQWDEALRAYRLLSDIRDVAIERMPADLQGRRAACGVLEESGRTAALAPEAQTLAADLVAGHWILDRPAWELTAEDVERWTGHALAIAAEHRLVSSAADALWPLRDFFGDLFANPAYQPFDLTPEQVFLADEARPNNDPFDGLICAAARRLDLPLITRDAEIERWGQVRVVW
jgi:hypothetical protein